MATRSPFSSPSARNRAASASVALEKASKLTRSSSWIRKVLSPCVRPTANTAASVGGAFFHVRTGSPRIVTVSISSGWPGAVSMAWACAIDMAGQAVMVGIPQG